MSAMGPVLHYIRAADRLVTEETLAKSDSSNRVCASPNKSWAPRVSIRNTSDALSRRPFWPSSRPQDFVHLCLPSAQRGNLLRRFWRILARQWSKKATRRDSGGMKPFQQLRSTSAEASAWGRKRRAPCGTFKLLAGFGLREEPIMGINESKSGARGTQSHMLGILVRGRLELSVF